LCEICRVEQQRSTWFGEAGSLAEALRRIVASLERMLAASEADLEAEVRRHWGQMERLSRPEHYSVMLSARLLLGESEAERSRAWEDLREHMRVLRDERLPEVIAREEGGNG
jgi:hypothetical protein